jgi:hypothetical protein
MFRKSCNGKATKNAGLNHAEVFFSGSNGAMFADSTTPVEAVATSCAEGVEAEKGARAMSAKSNSWYILHPDF